VAVIQEAWIGGVSTRRVDDLVQAMGLTGISKSTVSKLCKDIDDRVRYFSRPAAHRRLALPLAGCDPRLRGGRLYLKVRQGGRIVSVAAIIAMAVNTDGRREVIGLAIRPSEAETFWTDFLRSALAHVPKGQHTVVAAAIRQAFNRPDRDSADETWRHVADQLRSRWPKLAALMDESEADVLAYWSSPGVVDGYGLTDVSTAWAVV